jgi:hypothetical protein
MVVYFCALLLEPCCRLQLLPVAVSTLIRTTLTEWLEALDGAPAWPTVMQCLYFRLLTLLYPVSDFRHSVLTPLSLLICSHLTLCLVRNRLAVCASAHVRVRIGTRWVGIVAERVFAWHLVQLPTFALYGGR